MNLTGMKETWMDKGKRKPYLVALLLAVLYVIDIFFISGYLGMKLGIAGTVVHELILAGMGVGVFSIFRGKLKVIFPFRKPEWRKVLGTILLWRATYLLAALATVILMFFFPEQVMEASGGVDNLIMSIPVLLGLFVVAVVPAVCEEIAFRGALLSCFRGNKNKWIGIVIVSLFFGACHGSIWRMVPTAILGIGMGYLLLETDNMFYNMLFHFINNAVPVLLLGAVNVLVRVFDMSDLWDMALSTEASRVSLAMIGSYISSAGAVPILLYLGNYFLHRGQPGYDKGVFPPEKKKLMTVMVGVGVGMMALGAMLTFISTGFEVLKSMRWMY